MQIVEYKLLLARAIYLKGILVFFAESVLVRVVLVMGSCQLAAHLCEDLYV